MAVTKRWNVGNVSNGAIFMPARITIRDVAERAGCGVATVSRVLNNSGPASAAVRARVVKVAEELGFEFSDLGRSLQSRRSRTLAVLVPSLRNDVFAMAIEGMQEAAAAEGYQILLSCVNYQEDAEIEAVRTFVSKQVDGVLLTVANPDDSLALAYLKRHGVPYCLMFNQPTSVQPSVGVNNVAAAAMVGNRLLDAGHRDVGFVALRFRASERSRMRYEGLRTVMLAAGHAAPQLLEIDGDADLFQDRLEAFLGENPEMTAVFASNDLLALACIKAFRRMGKRVPGDISIVGFDGIEAGELVEPTLASVVTPNSRMGALAFQTVIRAIEQEEPAAARQVFLPFEFRSGGSLAPAPSKNTGDRAATRPPVCLNP